MPVIGSELLGTLRMAVEQGWRVDLNDRDQGSMPLTGEPEVLRLLLLAPDDVLLERHLACEAVARISRTPPFRGRVQPEIVVCKSPATMMQRLVPGAHRAKEPAREQSDDWDLYVFILWSQIGALPDGSRVEQSHRYPDPSREGEALKSLAAHLHQQSANLWCFQRQEVPRFRADDPALSWKLKQWRLVNQFFRVAGDDQLDRTNTVNAYQTPDHFRQQFERCLGERLEQFVQAKVSRELPDYVGNTISNLAWKGCPFPGLRTFSPEQKDLFFGRGAQIDQLIRLISDPLVRFVAVVGVSGCGKSSLVNAGLLPRTRVGVIDHVGWVDLVVRPAGRGGDPFLALAAVLQSKIQSPAWNERDLADAIKENPGRVGAHLSQVLQNHKRGTELLLVIDQFEELFATRASGCRDEFLVLLGEIVAFPKVRVIVLLRAEFYPRALDEPIFADLLRRSPGTFTLDAPDLNTMQSMITGPAEAGGVELEAGFLEQLLEDAEQEPNALPVLAFVLHRLFQTQKSLRYFSVDAYRDLGTLRMAIANYAERFLQNLPRECRSKLPDLFSRLVDSIGHGPVIPMPLESSLLDQDTSKLADELVSAGLLIAGKGVENQPTVELAHDSLLCAWPILVQWLQSRDRAVEIRHEVEQQAAQWVDQGMPYGALSSTPKLEYDRAVAGPLSPVAERYVRRSRQKFLVLRILKLAVFTLPIIFSALAILHFSNTSEYPVKTVAKALLTQLGLWPAPEPEMVRVPKGEFKMGDVSDVGEATELPVHSVRFEKAFEIGKYEVTFDEYDVFAAATGRDKPDSQGWGRGNRPVINVSWWDADAFTGWLSKLTGLNYRLPSEAEWEYAARATTTTPRYWSEKPNSGKDSACLYANVFDAGNELLVDGTFPVVWNPFACADDFPFTAPVGKFTGNRWGLHDMLGNVWEWNQDCYYDDYQDAPTDGSSREPEREHDCSSRVLRGGSWGYDPQNLRASFRAGNVPSDRGANIGFRIVRVTD